jgi:NTE family protein
MQVLNDSAAARTKPRTKPQTAPDMHFSAYRPIRKEIPGANTPNLPALSLMSLIQDPVAEPTGLLLSGGGARAAYQIGVLRGVAEILPSNAPNPFNVISGTSAGALNAALLATHAPRLRTGVRTLEHIWKNLSSEKVYTPQSSTLLKSASNVLLSMLSSKASEISVAILDNSPLTSLLERVINFERIQRNIDLGYLDALGITASAYDTGESVSFYQAVQGIADWQGPHRIGRRTELQLKHLAASSAIPIIFPAVKIDDRYFGDGSVRQLAPTSTAIHLGARRLFAIGVSANRSKPRVQSEASTQPTLTQILGHIMNSAFVDTLENDLEFLQHMNALVPHVPMRARRMHGIEVSHIELLEIAPSVELNDLALDYYDELPKSMARYIKKSGSGSLLSLILFEPGFCNALLQLGYADALAKREEIAAFFRLTL